MEELIKEVIDFKDWGNMPSEYQWRALDEDGQLYYYDDEPTPDENAPAMWVSGKKSQKVAEFGGQLPTGQCIYWLDTLQKRPTQ